MKKFIFICLFISAVNTFCFGENKLLQHLRYINNYTSIPYRTWTDNDPFPRAAFRIDVLAETSFENFVWKDLALTQKETINIDPETGIAWSVESMIRKFQTDTEYILFSAVFGVFDFVKVVLVTIDKNGNYIDSIVVGAELTCCSEDCYPMKWEITDDLVVKSYQLKPTSSTPILYSNEIPNTLEAQRIDRTYSLGSDGKFTEIETKYYEPQNYSKEKFLNKGYNIASGSEKPVHK